MGIASRLIGRAAGLRPPTCSFRVERGLRVPMSDGVTLLADRYYPLAAPAAPIILVRSPYGRRQFGIFSEVFASRGYQAVIQSSRGTFGSGGRFDAFRNEGRDGQATLTWLAGQPWFGGSVATYGPSYLGFSQWALAVSAPTYLKAMAIQIAASNRRPSIYPGGAFALDNALSWSHTIRYQEKPFWRMQWAARRQRHDLAPAFAHVPLAEADTVAFGATVPYYQDWLTHDRPEDPFWQSIDYSEGVTSVSAAVNLVGGWYDYFLPGMLADYASLRQAGHRPHLTIGPWPHVSLGVVREGLRQSLGWFDAHLLGDTGQLRPLPVRLFVMGSKRWLDLPDWPPPSKPMRLFLQPGGALSEALPPESPPDEYVYDPANPTPSVGGPVIAGYAGARDNREVERRPDVLVYTTPPLERDLEVVGPVTAVLHVRSSLLFTDFFVRLCVVETGGRSINLCDGLIRLEPGKAAAGPDDTLQINVELSPTANRFRRGQRIRVQVASGAHPRISRNPGSGEDLATATKLFAAHQSVYHDPTHPSVVVLPVHILG